MNNVNSFGFPIDFELGGSWDLISLVNRSKTTREYLNEWDGTGNDYIEPSKKLDEFLKKNFSGGECIFLGNWNPEYEEEDWDYFYEETGLNENDHGLITFCDGDDGEFTILHYRYNIDSESQEMEDFKKMIGENDYRHLLLEF